MQITENQKKAAIGLAELISKELAKNSAVHPATAIAAAARLGGSFMFRSFNLKLENVSPGNVVLSEEANEKFPVLINITGGVLSSLGIDIDQKKLGDIPMEKSNLELLDTLNLLQDKAAGIMSKNKLEFEQMACSCAIATAFIIKEYQQYLAAEAGFNTAVYSFIEGSKTYPPELTAPAPGKKNIFSFWK